MTKGQDTKYTILKTALDMVSESSLEAITIGTLAKATEMSKSGLFAHFQSKENLQIAILEFAAEEFFDCVVLPALKRKAGILRIKTLVKNWIKWGEKLKGGCVFVSVSAEFSERPGNVRDFLLTQQETWIESLKKIGKSAVRVKDFRNDIDCDQFAFDLYSLLLGYHYYSILLPGNKAVKHLEKALNQMISTYR